MIERGTISRNLRRWTVYVLLSASGSFACAYTDQWHRPQAVVGMLWGIIVFIGVYTAVCSSVWFRQVIPPGSLNERAFLYAARLRSFLGLLSSLIVVLINVFKKLPEGIFALTLPDSLPAFMIGLCIESLRPAKWVRAMRVFIGGTDAHQRAQNLWIGDVSSLVPTFLITLTQGVFLSLILVLFAAIFRSFLMPEQTGKTNIDPDVGVVPTTN